MNARYLVPLAVILLISAVYAAGVVISGKDLNIFEGNLVLTNANIVGSPLTRILGSLTVGSATVSTSLTLPFISSPCQYLATDSSGAVICGTTTFVSGSGTTNYVPKWTSSTTLGSSAIYDASGKIGIGTTSPSYYLDVRHTGSKVFRAGDNAGDDLTIDIAAGAGLANIVAGAEWNGTTYLYTGTRGASRIRLHDGTFSLMVGGTSGTAGSTVTWTTVMEGLSTGYAYFPNRVGIGTTSPAYALDVAGDIHASGNVYAGDLVFKNGFRFVEDGNGAIVLKNPEGVPILKIDANGNIWIRGEIRRWE